MENSYLPQFPMPQQGWECPKCHRVYSPVTPCCFYCGNAKIEITVSSEEKMPLKDTLLKG